MNAVQRFRFKLDEIRRALAQSLRLQKRDELAIKKFNELRNTPRQ